MATIKELEQARDAAIVATEEAVSDVIVRARVVVSERRTPSFPTLPKVQANLLQTHLDNLARATDVERAAQEALIAARETLIAAYNEDNERKYGIGRN